MEVGRGALEKVCRRQRAFSRVVAAPQGPGLRGRANGANTGRPAC